MNYPLDIWTVNAAVEGVAGVVAMMAPQLMPMFKSLRSGQGPLAVRFWAASIMSLAVISFFVSPFPDSPEKGIIALGMGLYHVLLTILLIPGPPQVYVGFLVHVPFAALFLNYARLHSNLHIHL